MRRRNFLRTTGTVGAVALGSAFGILKYPRGARAAGWGAWPADKIDAILPPQRQATNVLELHINGGLNPWDTFYTVPTWGIGGDYRYVNQFAPAAPIDLAFSRDARFEECNYGTAPDDLWESAQIEDANGVELFLGPWLMPLRARPDILARMRIMVQRHDQVAHEGGNPVSFTGDRIGQPRLAGLGTAIQRYFSENVEAGGGLRAAPYAYVLYPGAGFSTFNSLSASAVGFHPGSARPLGVTVDQNSLLNDLLARPGLVEPEQFDAAITYYRQAYENRFRAQSLGSPARSPERGNYEFSDFARRNAAQLQDILSGDLFEQIDSPNPAVCNDFQQPFDMSRMQARLAASLLTRPTDAARYVLWIDTGIRPAQNGGHDTHYNHTNVAAQNIPNTMAALAEIIGDGPDQINLDDTMIVINTEFGRAPTRQVDTGNNGTNHWPWGYVNVVIGGPIQERGVFGAVEEVDGYALQDNYITPAENRIMVMQSLGIYPFSSQSFAVSDVRGGVEDELEAATRVRDVYMGVTP